MESPGEFIGPYQLLAPIGEGGFGTVWRAEQAEPIHREVALKVIKPGMDSREIIARFEAERQALAMMDHPNIAAVLDAGSTQNGRPYFVMELVKGVPITEYCNAHMLTIRERLDQALPLKEETFKLMKVKLGPEHTDTLITAAGLGIVFSHAKRYAEAEPLLIEAHAGFSRQKDRLSMTARSWLFGSMKELAALYAATDKPGQAAIWRKKLEELQNNGPKPQPSAVPPPSAK